MAELFQLLRQLPLTYKGTEEIGVGTGMRLHVPPVREYRFAFVVRQKLKASLEEAGRSSDGTAEEGELFLIPSGAECTLVNPAAQRGEALLIGFTYAGRKRSPVAPFVQPHDLFDRFGFRTFRLPQMAGWQRDFRGDNGEDDPVLFYRLQSYVYALASAFIQTALRPSPAEEGLPARVERARLFLHGHYGEPVDIEGLARSSGAGVSRFYAAFRSRTGLSPHKYLTKLRMEAALRSLAAPASTVTGAAHEAGYPDEYYFSRLFRKQMGLTPTEYARQAGRRVVCLCPASAADLKALGLAPAAALEPDPEADLEHALRQVAAAEPELIVTGELPDAWSAALLEGAPAAPLGGETRPWKERLLALAGQLGLTGVAEWRLAHYDSQLSNARTLVKRSLAGRPVIAVRAGREGFRVRGPRDRLLGDFFYGAAGLAAQAPEAVRGIETLAKDGLQPIAELGCDHVLLLLPPDAGEARGSELSEEWRLLRRGRGRSLTLRVPDCLYPHLLLYEDLLEQIARQLLAENKVLD